MISVCEQQFRVKAVLWDHEVVVKIVHEHFREVYNREADVDHAGAVQLQFRLLYTDSDQVFREDRERIKGRSGSHFG